MVTDTYMKRHLTQLDELDAVFGLPLTSEQYHDTIKKQKKNKGKPSTYNGDQYLNISDTSKNAVSGRSGATPYLKPVGDVLWLAGVSALHAPGAFFGYGSNFSNTRMNQAYTAYKKATSDGTPVRENYRTIKDSDQDMTILHGVNKHLRSHKRPYVAIAVNEKKPNGRVVLNLCTLSPVDSEHVLITRKSGKFRLPKRLNTYY